MNAATRAQPVLQTRDLTLRFGGLDALAGVTLAVPRGELCSIIGPNGAGKTSLLNCISGRYAPSAGQVLFEGRDITRVATHRRAALGIGRTFQNLALFAQMSVLDNIMVGRHHRLQNNFITGSVYWLTGARREELAQRHAVGDIVKRLGLQRVQHAPAGTLSYGMRKRVELARALAIEPSLLLLDEPMAGMNPHEKADLARCIVELAQERAMTVVMIEHDVGVVMDISQRVVVLDFGRVIAAGRPADVLADQRVRDAYLGADFERAA